MSKSADSRPQAFHGNDGQVAWLRFPMKFDAEQLRGDLANVPSGWWIDHFNRDDYAGKWSIAPLRGPAGEVHPIRMASADPGAKDWANTALMDLCPAMQRVISNLDCPVKSTRLLNLASGAEILPHTDHNLGFEDGEVRLHIPIRTSPLVEFWVADQRIDMQPGELWYVNVNLPHRVHNRSPLDRIHLVIDCQVNQWMRQFFEVE